MLTVCQWQHQTDYFIVTPCILKYLNIPQLIFYTLLSEHLTSLVQSAEENGVIFFYALSPGLDITYSNAKEITALKRKLEQVS